MRRRTVLAVVPALLAGCIEISSNPGDGTPVTRATTSTSATTSRVYDLIPAESESMSADEVRQRLDGRTCTSLSRPAATCPGDDGQLSVSVTPRVGAISGEGIEFAVENRADDAFQWNPFGWRLQKWDGSVWRHVAPFRVPAPLDSIPPGDSHSYVLSVDNDLVRDTGTYVVEKNVTLTGIGPGVYGFSIDGYFESSPDDERAAAAVLGFAGEGPPVRPTDEVESVERKSSGLVVRADTPSGEAGELTVSFTNGNPDARLLPEHVLQFGALRNTLPYAATTGVETIRYIGEVDDVERALRAIVPDGTSSYGFRDYVFEISTEDP